MKAVILCGGQGTRIRDVSDNVPKPMIEIGGHPILYHIMKTYAHYGVNEFILCLGYKGEVIKRYFHDFKFLNNDFTIDLKTKEIKWHGSRDENNWKVTLVDTGMNSMTGARVKRIEKYIDEDVFFLTYGDGVADINISDLLNEHKSHGKIGTVTGVFPPSRYGELVIQNKKVTSFSEKPEQNGSSINGGYFVFNRDFFKYLNNDENLVLEKSPLERLAHDGQLHVFQHKDFWQCMDTFRDYKFLTNLWEENKAPWKVWKDV